MCLLLQVAVLTNGSEDIAKSVLSKAGVIDITKPLLDINMAKAWKPFPAAYHFAVIQLHLAAPEVMLVASHPWDVHGALRAGLRAVYVQRDPAEKYPAFLRQPEAIVRSFRELVDKMDLADKR